jgi:hypothetical protein
VVATSGGLTLTGACCKSCGVTCSVAFGSIRAAVEKALTGTTVAAVRLTKR